MVAPFENLSAGTEFNWIGESFAVMLSDLLATPGLDVISPEERRLIYQRLRIPQAAVLTRASAIRVAEFGGANLLVFGSYEVSGPPGEERVRVLSRPVDLEEGKMIGAELNAGGPLKDLSEIQGALAWEILISRDRNIPFSRQRLTSQAAAFPTVALEYYTKGMMTEDLQSRANLLRAARRRFGKMTGSAAYARTAFDLGRAIYDSGQYAEAVPFLKEVPPASPHYDEARFYLGVALYQSNSVDESLSVYQSLLRSVRLPEVLNNLAVVEMKKNLISDALPRFSQAVASAAEDPDIRFNYAYALWLGGDYGNAIAQLRQVLKRRNTDGEAHYLLAKALERSGQSQEAQGPLNQARRYLNSYAQWESAGKIPMLARIKSAMNRSALYAAARLRASEGIETRRQERSKQIDQALASVRQSIDSQRDLEAFAALQKLIQIAPDSAEVHFLMARVLERRGDYRSSVSELQAATFWNPEHTAAYILLARIYFTLRDTAQARETLSRALRLDPKNTEALKLQTALNQAATPNR